MEKRNKHYDVENIIMLAVCFIVLYGANVLFNSNILAGDRVFYLDDLEAISRFMNSTGFLNYVFSRGANKIRPVLRLFLYIMFKLVGTNYEAIDSVLMMINYFFSIFVFGFMYWLQEDSNKFRRLIISTICGVLYIASHFAYYNISEIFGIMEALGNAFALGVLLCLLVYLKSEKKRYFYIAVISYFLAIYTHERYFVLFFLFCVACILKKGKKPKDYFRLIVPSIVFVTFWLLRIVLFGNRFADGTGGTNIVETFSFSKAFSFAVSQIRYIFGFNDGQAYLCGIEYHSISKPMLIVLIIRLVFILYIFGRFCYDLWKNRHGDMLQLKFFIMFIIFIGLCIVCSSTTIRVEMRWIYVSYTAFVIALMYMFSGLSGDKCRNYEYIALLLFFILTMSSETYYRGYYYNVYYWKYKDMSKALYEVTVKSYGEDLKGKNIVLINDNPYFTMMKPEDWQKFFAPYIQADEICVDYAMSIAEAQKIYEDTDDVIFLIEDEKKKAYIDISSMWNNISFLYGVYEDKWIATDCAISIISNQPQATLTFYSPKEIEGNETGKIYVNGEYQRDWQLTDYFTTISVELQPGAENIINIISDFCIYENTGREQGENLSCVLADIVCN